MALKYVISVALQKTMLYEGSLLTDLHIQSHRNAVYWRESAWKMAQLIHSVI